MPCKAAVRGVEGGTKKPDVLRMLPSAGRRLGCRSFWAKRIGPNARTSSYWMSSLRLSMRWSLRMLEIRAIGYRPMVDRALASTKATP